MLFANIPLRAPCQRVVGRPSCPCCALLLSISRALRHHLARSTHRALFPILPPCSPQVGKAISRKPALSLNKERLLGEGVTDLGTFSCKYLKPARQASP